MRFILSVLLFLLYALSSASSQWQRSISPYEANVQQLIADDSVLVAWGYGGLFRSTDRGQTWSGDQSLPLSIYVPTMLKTSIGSYIIITTDTMRRSTDQGATWNVVRPVDRYSVKRLYDAGHGLLLLDQTRDSLLRSTDDGLTWSGVTTMFNDSSMISVARHGSSVLAGFRSAGLWRSTDEGTTWMKMSEFTLSWGVTSLLVRGDTIYAGIMPSSAQNYGAVVSYDGGETWRLLNYSLLSFNSIVSMVWYRNSVYGVLQGGPIFNGPVARLVDDKWIGPALSRNTERLVVDGERLYAATEKDGVWYKPHPDSSFRSLNIGLQRDVSILDYVDTDSGVLAVAYSGLFASSDDGATWKATGEGTASLFASQYNHALASFRGRIYCSMDKGVMISSNGGVSWESCRGILATTNAYGGVLALDTMVLVATSDGVFRMAKDGVTGEPLGTGLRYTPVNDIAEHGDHLFAGTDQEGPWRSTNGGESWHRVGDGFTSKRIWKFFTIDGQLYASSDTATYRWLPASSSWRADRLGMENDIRLWAVLETGGATFAAISHLGNGGEELGRSLYMSQDGGRTWSDVTGNRLRDVNIYALHRVGDQLLAGTFNYGTWRRAIEEMTGSASSVDMRGRTATYGRPSLSLRVQPVPAMERATITFLLSVPREVRISIVDALGRESLRVNEMLLDAGEHVIALGTNSLTPGLYFCRVEAEDLIGTTRLIVVR